LSTWGELQRLVDAQPPPADRVSAVLHGTVEQLRDALADPDGDGSTNIEEDLAGTSREHWDTDGDGWWDGAPEERPEHAVPLPRDGSWICFATVPALGSSFEIQLGGFLDGQAVPDPLPLEGPAWTHVSFEKELTPWEGGAWAAPVLDKGGVANPHCGLRLYATAVSEIALGPKLERLADALDAALRSAAGIIEVDGRRVVLEVRTGSAKLARAGREGEERVTIGAESLELADLSAVAQQAVALQVLGAVHGPRDAAAALAFAEDLSGRRFAQSHVAAISPEAGPWRRAVRACTTGWKGILAAHCPWPVR
jgi:hypothetical protein